MKESLNQLPEIQSETDLTSPPEDLTVIVGGEPLEADHEAWPEIGFPPIMGGAGDNESLGEQPVSDSTGGQMEVQRQTDNPRWVSLEEAARKLGITERSVRRIVRKGKARAEVEERTVIYRSIKRVSLADLEKYRAEIRKFDPHIKNKR